MLLILTGTLTALMAGLFFAWSCSVTLGLRQLSDEGYLAAMQAMNRAILNPVFFICFFGTAFLLPLSTYLEFDRSTSARFWYLLAAACFYLLGVMGVTIFGNIPLNNALEAFNLESASSQDMAKARANFETRWNLLNHVRAIAGTIAIILFIKACLTDG
jgi:uncharacterized membrane protein